MLLLLIFLNNNEFEKDFIPLSEVTSVETMSGVEEAARDNAARKQGSSLNLLLQKSNSAGSEEMKLPIDKDSIKLLFVNAFQIATIPDGYNSGRSYYLQADSGEVKQQIIDELTQAKKNEVASKWFEGVLKSYESKTAFAKGYSMPPAQTSLS
jgi:hypothetical protein